jgi:hypothetical protein
LPLEQDDGIGEQRQNVINCNVEILRALKDRASKSQSLFGGLETLAFKRLLFVDHRIVLLQRPKAK